MGRIVAIDYGTKKVGIAVTDPLKIIATGLATVHSSQILDYLITYSRTEEIETIVVGLPKQSTGEPSETEKYILPFIKKLKSVLPGIEVVRFDERYTTVLATRSLLDGGYKKKDRQNKKLLDSVSATIILQDYLNSAK
ncbi:MAG: Holliday junction resolvase RuvX [Flavobacteriales bacterium]|nr:Holliday junction resolvase RuvX [Flavobacteriales bacterium]